MSSHFYDIFRISRQLERQHSLFYMIWEMGQPVFTDKVKTAAVSYDRTYGELKFQFNPKHWDGLTDYDRSFLVAHQSLHIILRHGMRIKDADKNDRDLVDQTLDGVVNELLVNKFGFKRERLTNQHNYCWLDTLFPDEDVPDDECFEWYYNKLKEQRQQEGGGSNGSSGGGSGGKGKKQKSKGKPDGNSDGESDEESEKQEGSGNQDQDNPDNDEYDDSEQGNQPMDDHGGLSEDDAEEILSELDDLLSNREKHEIEQALDQHVEGGQAGDFSAGHWSKAKVGKVKKKRKWETIIKKWSMRYDNPELIDVEQWSRTNRRFALVTGNNVMLPSEYEMENEFDGRIEVWFFQDTSGSCNGFRDRFFSAAMTLPEKRFKVRMFCFDTAIYPTDLKSKQMYGGGGTTFTCIENYVRSQPQYPKALFVITDGVGNQVSPQYPNRWHVFLAGDHSKSCFPKTVNFYDLANFE